MKRKLFLLLAAITLINGLLIANIKPVLPEMEYNPLIGITFIMDLEITGTLNLYSILKEDIELIDTEVVEEADKGDNDWFLVYNRDYYIGYTAKDAVAVSPSNFKRTARKYFSNTPELAENIGKKGFRYKNLPSMIKYYNKKVMERKAVTKEDRLLVKEIK